MEQRDGGFVAIVVALYLGQKLLDAATDRLTAAVLDWATTHLRPLIRGRGTGESLRIPIYGPDGEVIREVVVPEDDEDAV